MTPKEKAIELFDKYFVLVNYPTPNWKSVTKQCALIAVDEILEAIFWHPLESPNHELEYWQEVKQEIESL